MEPLEEWNFGDTSEIANWRPRREELPEGWSSVVSRIEGNEPPTRRPNED
jgi:hypothetical protein